MRRRKIVAFEHPQRSVLLYMSNDAQEDAVLQPLRARLNQIFSTINSSTNGEIHNPRERREISA